MLKEGLFKKKPWADCRRQSYDKDPELGICAVVGRRGADGHQFKKRKIGRRLLPGAGHSLLKKLSPNVQNDVKNAFKGNLYTQWGALASW